MAPKDATTDKPSGNEWAPWVYFDIEWSPRRGRFPNRPILLTIHFGEHHLDVLGGAVWFGLRGAELQVTPSSGRFAPEHLWPENPLDVTVEVDRTETSGHRDKRRGSMGAKVRSKDASAQANATTDREVETNALIEDAFKHVHWRIVAQGAPTSPLWKFSASAREPFLQGRLTSQQIGRLSDDDDGTASLSAELRIFKKDIRPTTASGLWPEDISHPKRAILMALLRKWLIAPRICPTVCLVELPPLTEEAANG